MWPGRFRSETTRVRRRGDHRVATGTARAAPPLPSRAALPTPATARPGLCARNLDGLRTLTLCMTTLRSCNRDWPCSCSPTPAPRTPPRRGRHHRRSARPPTAPAPSGSASRRTVAGCSAGGWARQASSRRSIPTASSAPRRGCRPTSPPGPLLASTPVPSLPERRPRDRRHAATAGTRARATRHDRADRPLAPDVGRRAARRDARAGPRPDDRQLPDLPGLARRQLAGEALAVWREGDAACAPGAPRRRTLRRARDDLRPTATASTRLHRRDRRRRAGDRRRHGQRRARARAHAAARLRAGPARRSRQREVRA